MFKKKLKISVLILILVLPFVSAFDGGLPQCAGSDSELLFGCGFGEQLIFLSGDVPTFVGGQFEEKEEALEKEQISLLIIILPIALLLILIIWFFIAKRKGKKTKDIIP